MRPSRVISHFLVVLLANFCVFPVALWILPQYNVKMLMAGVGLVMVVVERILSKNHKFDRGFLFVSFFAALVSCIVFASITINNTTDTTLLSYVVSVWVWLAAAYVVCRAIYALNGKIDVPTLAKYLLAVAALQCILALLLDAFPAFQTFASTHFIDEYADIEKLQRTSRMYGIGAALDYSGIRFACILILSAHLIVRETNPLYCLIYFGGFIFVTIIGCMIARTTITGCALGLAYLAVHYFTKFKLNIGQKRLIAAVLLVGAIIGATFYVSNRYRTDENFKEHMRFGFEGLFSLAETGSFETGSTNTLKNMFVLPETLHTWVIGDGYFQGAESDPNYLGEHWVFFYKGTDVGYLRFIFYIGLVGMLALLAVFVSMTAACIKKLPEDKVALLLLFLENLLVWIKVASDTLVIFALVMCVDLVQNRHESENMEIE